MEVRQAGSRLEFSGILDEQTMFGPMLPVWQAAREASQNGRIDLDFSGVRNANSVGLLSYIVFLHNLNIPITYVNTPIWLVEQFSMLAELLAQDVQVESIQARFYCPQTDTMHTLLLNVGKDFPLLKNYSSLELHLTSKEGYPLEPDFDAEAYFFFVTNLTQKKGSDAK